MTTTTKQVWKLPDQSTGSATPWRFGLAVWGFTPSPSRLEGEGEREEGEVEGKDKHENGKLTS